MSFEYDCIGSRTKVFTSSLTFEYEYNLVGRMTEKKDATETLTMTFEYDAGGRRTLMRKQGRNPERDEAEFIVMLSATVATYLCRKLK